MSEAWEYPFQLSITVEFRDLDLLGHVNHAVYLQYFESARIAYAVRLLGATEIVDLPFIVAEASVTYLRQLRYGATIEVGVRVGRIGTKSLTMEYALRASGGEMIARGSTALVWFDYATNRSAPVPEHFRVAVARAQRESGNQDPPR